MNVYIASEFRYQDPILGPRDLVLLISQSGETADTVAALRLAKERGAQTLAVVNVVGSTVAREADRTLLTLAGPEISVASTKAYASQITVMYAFAIKLAVHKGTLSSAAAQALLEELTEQVPAGIEAVIAQSADIRALAGEFLQCPSVFFIGRGLDCLLASEGSLKLKEITYIHSEAYAAGEMKHGTISLISDGTPVIALATNAALREKMLSNVKEVKSRGASVILLCRSDEEADPAVCDHVIRLPEGNELFSPFTAIAALQLLSYYTAVRRGCDVDRPRNLAKSVTVE